MRLTTAFSLSFYLALALAASALTLAESFFLPWFVYVLPLLVVAFVLSWQREGVWLLSDTAANYLGIVIALVTVGAILFELPSGDEESLMTGLPWPAGLLPSLGPLLILLLVVKLFRPKRLADFWIIQTIGLMMVTLGCVLAFQPLFGLVFIAYLGALLWCLALFHNYREALLARFGPQATPLFPGVVSLQATKLPWLLLGVPRVLLWLALLLAVALPLFFSLPRSGSTQWIPQQLTTSSSKPKVIKTGVEAGIDLYRTGQIEPSPEEAFRVVVTDDSGRRCAAPPNLLWRVDVLDCYRKGRWHNWTHVEDFKRFQGMSQPVSGEVQPGASEHWHLRFELVPLQAGGLVLAEPVHGSLVGQAPLLGERRPTLPFFHELSGTDTVLPILHARRRKHSYGQVIPMVMPTDRIPAGYVSEDYREYLLGQGGSEEQGQSVPEDVSLWTHELILHLHTLSDEDRQLNKDEHLDTQHHAKVARALRDYLASSGLFRYTLDLRRKDFKADPSVDFLLNTKEGHCERFAGGLALMLRSLGIPARVIKGYRGGERQEDDSYIVRFADAHSWVQALVDEGGQSYWLILDATPSGDTGSTEPFSLGGLVRSGWRDSRMFWSRFILEYNVDLQLGTIGAAGAELMQVLRAAGPYATWLTPPLLLFWFVWYTRRFWAKSAAARAADAPPNYPAFYQRYLDVLSNRLQLVPATGQTPLEFGGQVAEVLRSDRRCSGRTDLPEQVVTALYRDRFADERLTFAEETQLMQETAALDRVLLEST